MKLTVDLTLSLGGSGLKFCAEDLIYGRHKLFYTSKVEIAVNKL